MRYRGRLERQVASAPRARCVSRGTEGNPDTDLSSMLADGVAGEANQTDDSEKSGQQAEHT